MELTWLDSEAPLGARRGEVVVCLPVFGGHEAFTICLHSVLAHTPPEIPILICDDASPDERSAALVRSVAAAEASPHRVVYLRRPANLGFPANVNGAFAMAAPADVVILNSDCVVADGWLEGLREAAYSDSRIATATALTNHGSVVSVPVRGVPQATLPPGWTLDRAAAAVRAASLRIRPRLPTAVGHCALIRRDALELIGDFDLAFSPGYGEEVDFCQRCLQAGLSHVVADDVLVFHHGGASFASDGRRNPVQDEHERILATRYPYYHDAVRDLEAAPTGPLARAISVARRALTGTSVTIDARILSGPMTGTQLQVLEVVAALARTEAVRITAIVPDEPGDHAAQILTSLPRVRLVRRAEIVARGLPRADVVHRPYQVSTDEDVSFLAPLGERLVITNQDLISFANPGYFTSSRKWRGYRRLTRGALAVADRVVFISAHARDEALAEELLDPQRASVVANGVDHTLRSAPPEPVAPRGAERLAAGAEMMLCLGTDFRHKNRLFALRLLDELRRAHGWEGFLVLAGPHVARGASAPEEAGWLVRHPGLGDAVVELGAVGEAEKLWLFRRAGLVLYPTVHEGFGLIPFEAAEHGRPCLWAAGTSLAEVLPPQAAGIVAWDPAATAAQALRLLRDETARAENLAAVRAAAAGLTWDRTAAGLLEVYRQTCDLPATPAGSLERREGHMAGVLSEDAMRLIGPDGALAPDLERPLLALATHPSISAPLFGAIRLGYRAGYVWRRRLRRAPASASPNGRGPSAT
jgi:GT2 family glycosyltransferase/glycosyltransferase involved in cell wall biosynthesis